MRPKQFSDAVQVITTETDRYRDMRGFVPICQYPPQCPPDDGEIGAIVAPRGKVEKRIFQA